MSVREVASELARWLTLLISITFLVEGIYRILAVLLLGYHAVAHYVVLEGSVSLLPLLVFLSGIALVVVGGVLLLRSLRYVRERIVIGLDIPLFLFTFSLVVAAGALAIALSVMLFVCVILSRY